MKKTGTKTIRTNRLVLRRFRLTDYFSAIKWFTDPKIAAFSISKKPPTKWEVFKFIVGRIRRYHKKDFYSWAIVYDGKVHGFIELIFTENGTSRSVSYKLDMSLNGRGITTEALTAVIDYMKTQGLIRLIGVCDTDNIGSKRVMEKAGMTKPSSGKTSATIKYNDGTEKPGFLFEFRF